MRNTITLQRNDITWRRDYERMLSFCSVSFINIMQKNKIEDRKKCVDLKVRIIIC